MKIKVEKELETKAEALILGIFQKTDLKKENKVLSQELEHAKKRKIFKEKFGSTYQTKIPNSAYESILVINLGEKKKFSAELLRRAYSKAISHAKQNRFKTFTTNLSEISNLNAQENGRATAEGIILSDYNFSKYKKDETEKITEITIQWTGNKEFSKGITEGRTIAEATNYTRNLVNEPADVATPQYLEKEAKKLSRKNFKVTVLNKKEMEKLGMNALLAVAKGSDLPPKLIIMHYNNKKEPLTAIVGKGITFDSGGYLVKPAGYMEDMKTDMSGAAAILGTMKAISELKLKRNVLGVIPTCENMINGSAFRPGDILKAFNGKTIEVGHTDAEGRLILADALSYVEKKYKPKTMVDIATLTGACIVALGPYMSGLLTKNEKLASSLSKAGDESNDLVWRLPFTEDYDDSMEGTITDLNNLSQKLKSYAGATTAAVFLSNFVEKADWAHIDIAGTAYPKEAKYYNKKNSANGAGVRLLTYWLK